MSTLARESAARRALRRGRYTAEGRDAWAKLEAAQRRRGMVDHSPWSCDDADCGKAWCDRCGGYLFLCAVCGQAEAELDPLCPGRIR